MMPIGFSFGGRNRRRTNNQNSEIKTRVKNNLQTCNTNTSTVLSVVSELQALLLNVLAWYSTLVFLVRTFKQRAYVPYLHNKRVLYKLPYFLAKIEV